MNISNPRPQVITHRPIARRAIAKKESEESQMSLTESANQTDQNIS